MANKGLIGVQMSTIAPAKMPHFDAYESMGKLADIGYHCVEISQVPMTAENVAGFRKAIDELGLNVSSCTASTSPMLPAYFLMNLTGSWPPQWIQWLSSSKPRAGAFARMMSSRNSPS